ncbi:glycosyltransferase [Calidifontibacter sp. DB0510]|uniref:Glycosyltransferase n=1 Tax=Metallococcus carri TaxID=1656884 RepID=A0A967B2X1_9MICO|nr:glycosyltransferase [Metallococcus carri]NHN54657.1 glycosyltransferase [Metallococcus carri]NOP37002.1 glycosyltransferase [Calidifontibacter sp. DB2511S]
MSPPLSDRLTVVLLTYNCGEWIARTVDHLQRLGLPMIAVDNASRDDNVAQLTAAGVEVMRLPRNIGAAARNVGARRARTPYLAFCDDDGWFTGEGLDAAVAALDRHPRLALVNARILVGEEERLDPISAEMAQSPLPVGDLPGLPLLGFMAGAVIVRRSAFLDVGGYDERLFIGGEEETLAVPLAAAGWQLRYLPEVVVRHFPSTANAGHIRHFGVRNTLVTAWRHRPAARAASWTWFILRTTPSRRVAVRGLAMAGAMLPSVLRERRVIDAELDRQLTLLEQRRRQATPTRRRAAHSVW